MYFYPVYDEVYYEHNEVPFRPTRDQYECECGAELNADNLPIRCSCGAIACNECSYTCVNCGQVGCWSCMTDADGGWRHKTEL